MLLCTGEPAVEVECVCVPFFWGGWGGGDGSVSEFIIRPLKIKSLLLCLSEPLKNAFSLFVNSSLADMPAPPRGEKNNKSQLHV